MHITASNKSVPRSTAIVSPRVTGSSEEPAAPRRGARGSTPRVEKRLHPEEKRLHPEEKRLHPEEKRFHPEGGRPKFLGEPEWCSSTMLT